MFFEIILIALCFLSLFLCVEIIYKLTGLSAEITRKIVHVFSALILIFLPSFFSWDSIAVAAFLFVVVMLSSKKVHVFRSIHDTKRTTYGEIYLPLAVFLLALFEPSQLLFTYAILVLGIADTVAEIVGSKYGMKKIMGHKSFEGSLAFFICTWLIGFFIILFIVKDGILWSILITTSIASIGTLAEAISENGLDNLTIPLVIFISGIVIGL